MNKTPNCASEMGCTGEKCMWSATNKSCQRWCRKHANLWADGIVKVLTCARNPKMAAMLLIDRLGITGLKNLFLRPSENGALYDIPILVSDPTKDGTSTMSKDETKEIITNQLANGSIEFVAMSVKAYGLTGNPPQDVIDAWETQCTLCDMIDSTQWKGYPKRGISLSLCSNDTFLMKNIGGNYKNISKTEAISAFASIMRDDTLKGTQLMFSFEIVTTPWTYGNMIEVCNVLDMKTPEDTSIINCASGYGVRTFVYKPRSTNESPAVGGVHLSIDCGDFVAQWHTVTNMAMYFPMTKTGHVYFKVAMLW